MALSSQVVHPSDGGDADLPFTQPGVAVGSSVDGLSIDGMTTEEAKRAVVAWLEGKG